MQQEQELAKNFRVEAEAREKVLREENERAEKRKAELDESERVPREERELVFVRNWNQWRSRTGFGLIKGLTTNYVIRKKADRG